MTSLTIKPAQLWHLYPRETIAVGVLAAVSLMVASAAFVPALNPSPDGANAPPPPPLMNYQPVAAGDAIKLNAAIPLAKVDAGAAEPFRMIGSDAARANALECLTQAIYYEAGQESTDGQRGVAQVILNRVRHPAFPASVCGVVYQGSTRQTGCQFTFTCDNSMVRGPMGASWDRARSVARAALFEGQVYAPVGNATHYHANYVFPYWAPTLAKTAVVGAHIFYRWAGGWGQPDAFTQRYSGREASAAGLRTAALAIVRNPVVTSPATIAAMPIAKVEGVTVKQAEDGKRVRVLFTPQAREAVEKVAEARKPYVETVRASDNLRYALGETPAPSQEQPLGRPAATDTSEKAN